MQFGRAGTALVYLALVILTVVALKVGRPVLMPVALATLLAFLLSPLVSGLTRLHLRQSASVLIVVGLMFSLLGAMIWGFGTQLSALAYQLPDYKQNIREKIEDLRSAGSGSTLERIRQTWRELKGELKKSASANSTNAVAQSIPTGTNTISGEAEPVPVVVRGQSATSDWQLPTGVGPLVEILATAGLVIVIVIFMLLRKRELRNRVIVLFGYSRMPTTTRALDEAADRISRYLLMQTIINGSYGFAVGVALYFIGLPYALMWGVLAALFRFIPYVGPWIGATMPILLSLAVFPGWLHPFLVLGLFMIFELISNMFMEPLLYGQTVGVSEVALIIAVAFWTWLWGPIGLALATPLTVCLVVLGKYVPGLSILPLLMGDEPVMDHLQLFYQRLLATDDAEAAEIVQDYGKQHDLIQVYDDLLLPSLIRVKHDHFADRLSTEQLDEILGLLGQIITKAAEKARGSSVTEKCDNCQEAFGIPVEDTVDELAMSMLANILPPSVRLKSVSAEALSGEILDKLQDRNPAVVFIGAMAPGGSNESRYLIKRLQSSFPSLPLVLARWGLKNEKKLRDLSRIEGVSGVATTLKEARNFLMEMGRIAEFTPASPEPAASAQLQST